MMYLPSSALFVLKRSNSPPEHPDGTERLYAGGRFFAAPDMAETYGRDLLTGAPFEENAYKALNPEGRGLIRPAPYVPPHEPPSEDFPLQLATGRTLYHFHTRTKTGRAPQLRRAAPDVWVELSADDAAQAGLGEGDLVEVAGEAVVRLPMHLLDDDDRARLLEIHERRVNLFCDDPLFVPLGMDLLRDNRLVRGAVWQAYDARHVR